MQKDLRTAWLLVLLRDGESYGYELRRELAVRAMPLDPAVMYRTLRDMERGGLITSRWMHSQAGPKRRVYAITAPGLDELMRIAAAIQRTRDTQNAFLDALGRIDRTGADDPP